MTTFVIHVHNIKRFEVCSAVVLSLMRPSCTFSLSVTAGVSILNDGLEHEKGYTPLKMSCYLNEKETSCK